MVCQQPFYKKLYWQVFIGVGLGILLGYVAPDLGVLMKPWGDGFIKMLKMVIAPIIFCTLVVGIAGVADIKKMGKLGLSAILYFEIMTTLALAIGMVVMNLVPVGSGLHIQVQTLDNTEVIKFVNHPIRSVTDLILNIIPNSFVGAFADNEMMQVLFLSILTGVALQKLGGQENPVYKVIESASDMFFKMISILMALAPIGAFASMSYTVGKFGIITLVNLLQFVFLFWATAAGFVLIIMGAVLLYYRISIFKLIKYIKEEILIAIGTCSSEPLIPRLLEKLQAMGVKKETAGFVLPAGSAFNLDGTCLYFTMAAVFLAQATDVVFPWYEQVSLFIILLVTSKGANAVYGSAFIILGSTLGATGQIPVEAMAILLGIDRFMGMARTVMNMIGNCVATIVLSSNNKESKIVIP